MILLFFLKNYLSIEQFIVMFLIICIFFFRKFLPKQSYIQLDLTKGGREEWGKSERKWRNRQKNKGSKSE